MKKRNFSLLILITILTFNISIAQKLNVTNAALALNNDKDLISAKKYIDLAKSNSKTSDDPKMWSYYAKIYKTIFQESPEIDNEAIAKATEGYLKCIAFGEGEKGKKFYRKYYPRDQIILGLAQCGSAMFNFGVNAYNKGDFNLALDSYKKVEEILKYDEKKLLSNSKITKLSIVKNSFLAAKGMKNNALAKELLNNLILNNLQESFIYIEMSSLAMEEGDNEKAMEYLKDGRSLFPNDESLINSEIDLYLKLGKTEELISKTSIAIEANPDKDIYYVVRGNCYQNMGKINEAIKDYELALSINPSQNTALNNISSCYIDLVNDINKEKNKLSLRQKTKYNQLDKEAKILLGKVANYLSTYTDLNPKEKDKLKALASVYQQLGMYDKVKETEAKIKSK